MTAEEATNTSNKALQSVDERAETALARCFEKIKEACERGEKKVTVNLPYSNPVETKVAEAVVAKLRKVNFWVTGKLDGFYYLYISWK